MESPNTQKGIGEKGRKEKGREGKNGGEWSHERIHPHTNDMTNTPTKRKVTNVKERQTQGSN